MTNQDIETFFAVLDHGTMTAAAEALYITQPSLSARLKSLEDQVGAPLFHRGKGQRRITLTDAASTSCLWPAGGRTCSRRRRPSPPRKSGSSSTSSPPTPPTSTSCPRCTSGFWSVSCR